MASALQLSIRRTGRNSFGHLAIPGRFRHYHCWQRQDFRGRWRARAREFSFGGNRALRLRFRFESNPARIFRDQVRKLICPFDHRNAVAEKIIESQPFGRLICSRPRSQTLAGFSVYVARLPPAPLSIFETEKVEVINRNRTVGVFMDESKRWACYFSGTTETGYETFDELRLATAKFAGERQHIARLEIFREPTAEDFGFVRAI